MAYAWLTPDSIPSAVTYRALLIPDSVEWVGIVAGAISDLQFPYNWEQFGALTPDECAERMRQMFDEFTFNRWRIHMIGEFVPFAGTTNPLPGLWVPCDGQSVLRADYSELFAVIGTTYGFVDATHFNIPDLRKRTLVHVGTGYTLGTPIGESEHTLTWQEMPEHTHNDTNGHNHGYTYPMTSIINGGLEAPASAAVPAPLGVTEYGYVSLDNSGNGQAHNNIPPSVPVNYYIVARNV